jgi:hypothetical protein
MQVGRHHGAARQPGRKPAGRQARRQERAQTTLCDNVSTITAACIQDTPEHPLNQRSFGTSIASKLQIAADTARYNDLWPIPWRLCMYRACQRRPVCSCSPSSAASCVRMCTFCLSRLEQLKAVHCAACIRPTVSCTALHSLSLRICGRSSWSAANSPLQQWVAAQPQLNQLAPSAVQVW